jgi:dienelactone hydrolase
MKTRVVSSSIAGMVMLLANTAQAQTARQELHPIPATAIAPADFLMGQKGSPTTLAGQLNLPKIGVKLPAVILLHGAAGIGGTNGIYDAWVPMLNSAGIATFAVDSFAGRGIVNIPADVAKVSALTRIIDAFRALEVLAKHPSIDPARIAIMGFSHGSSAAMYSNVARFRRMHGSPDVQFAAHISVYGICTTTYRDDEDVTKPILMLHGTADDWLPIQQCREYAARLAKAGRDVRLIEYAGAHHAYDVPALKKEVKLPQAVTPRGCKLAEGDNGVIVNAVTSQPFKAGDSCLEKGVTVVYHEEAAKKSHEDVKSFLKEIFNLK